MKTRTHYQTPRVLKEVAVQLEADLLAASIVDDSLSIISDGQEVTDIDASSGDFQWNEKWNWE